MSKKYIEFINELSPDDVYKGLLAHGLFSEKLPPIFSSEQFYTYCTSNQTNFQKVPCNYINYENMRNINIPRRLGIPVPMAYYHLCNCLRDNWPKIQSHFDFHSKNQSHKVSRIHVRKIFNQPHIFEMNYGNWRVDSSPEPDLLIGKKFLVKADISSCFPSIYSHSLPWALATKNTAKANKNDKNLWYNQIDFYTRNTKYGETHGLLIGPHSSNILSEIVLTIVDHNLINKDWRFIRTIDDYICYIDSCEKGQEFLSDLNKYLREFGLVLNHKKTEILPLPTASSSQWVHQINTLLLHSQNNYITYKNIRSYLDTVIDILKTNCDNAAILNYAIKVLSQKKLTKNAQSLLIKTALHLAVLYPYLLPLLDEHIFMKFRPEKALVISFSQIIFDDAFKINNFEAASYALYFAIKYDFSLNKFDINKIVATGDCILLLLAYLYSKDKNMGIENKLLIKHAKSLKQKGDADMEEYWIFVYEVLTHGNLKSDWKKLKQGGISFIKPISKICL